MFARVATIFTFLFLVLPFLAAATAVPRGGGGGGAQPASQCNTGDLQCCNSVQSADSSAVGIVAGLLGIVLEGVTALVGLTCNPISAIGIGGNSCSQQPVCCTGNNFSGLLVLGCSPVNLNL